MPFGIGIEDQRNYAGIKGVSTLQADELLRAKYAPLRVHGGVISSKVRAGAPSSDKMPLK